MSFESAQEGHRTTVVVYERATGHIIHVHEVLTERGGQHPAEEAIQAAAIEHALEGPRGRQLTVSGLASLPLKEDFEPQAEHDYRIDLATRRLVRSPRRPVPGRRDAGE